MSSSRATDQFSDDRWIHLDGAVNVRDLGGLPVQGGGYTTPGRLLRSDNLQDLSDTDVRRLRSDLGLSDVVDLRTATERTLEGPGPLDDEPDVLVHHLSLLPAEGDAVRTVDGNLLLPWQQEREEVPVERAQSRSVYSAYLEDRPDSVAAALRVVARADGAVLLHCAAGKDRTGVIAALTLDLVGVDRDLILEDYLLTGERIDQILGRLTASRTYADNLRGRPRDSHLPRAAAITAVFDLVDEQGGVAGWLTPHGWSEADTAAVRTRLTA